MSYTESSKIRTLSVENRNDRDDFTKRGNKL